MQARVVASALTAILLAACASVPLDELPQSDDNLVGLVEGVRSVINNIQLK